MMQDDTLEALKQFVLTEEVILQGSRRVIRRKHVPQGMISFIVICRLYSLNIFIIHFINYSVQARENLSVLAGYLTKTLSYA